MSFLSRLAYSLEVSETTLLRAIPRSLVAVLVGFVTCVAAFIRFGGTA